MSDDADSLVIPSCSFLRPSKARHSSSCGVSPRISNTFSTFVTWLLRLLEVLLEADLNSSSGTSPMSFGQRLVGERTLDVEDVSELVQEEVRGGSGSHSLGSLGRWWGPRRTPATRANDPRDRLVPGPRPATFKSVAWRVLPSSKRQ